MGCVHVYKRGMGVLEELSMATNLGSLVFIKV